MRIAGVILAGGRARRMGFDKSLAGLAGQPLVAHVAARLKPQVEALVINANGDAGRFGFTGLEVVPDTTGDFAGPLAGVLAGLQWAQAHGFSHMATAATDTPFFPRSLVASLRDHAAGDTIPVARSRGRPHPVFSLWPVTALAALDEFLQSGAKASVLGAIEAGPHRFVDFDPVAIDGGELDPFFNINKPADLAAAERFVAECNP